MMSKFFGPDDGAPVLNDPRNVDIRDIEDELLDEVEQRAIKERARILNDLFGDNNLARYKIEVLFDRRKTSTGGAFPGGVVIWRSGSVLSGGGDELLYPCPDQKCKGVIGPEGIAPISQSCFCKSCSRVWRQSDLRELSFYNLDPSKWALVLTQLFLRLECAADVYMKWTGNEDIRSRTRMEQAGNRGGEELYAARRVREPVMYRCKDIVKDVNAGSSIESRMRALITG
jgi:hypothetical protein